MSLRGADGWHLLPSDNGELFLFVSSVYAELS